MRAGAVYEPARDAAGAFPNPAVADASVVPNPIRSRTTDPTVFVGHRAAGPVKQNVTGGGSL